MKVLVVCRSTDLGMGGVARVPYELSRGLERRGHKVTVQQDGNHNLYHYFLFTLGLNLLPRFGSYDIYHATSPMEGANLPPRKSVTTFLDLMMLVDTDKIGAGMGHSRGKSKIGEWYFKWCSLWSTRNKGLACISEKTRQDVIKCFGKECERAKVVRLGVNPELKPKHKRDELLRIGYLGQLDRRKRVRELVDTFMQSKLEAELYIGGTGIDEHYLRDLARDDGRVRFVGYVPESELCSFYNYLDIFVFPSWVEGYGLPIVEAMACKKPVVVLADGVIPWELKRRCAIASNLKTLLSNKDYLVSFSHGIDIEGNYEFAQLHSWEQCTYEYLKLYEEVLS